MRFILRLIFAVPFFLVAVLSSSGQNNSVSIGTPTTHPSAVLWLESSTGNQGFVIPVGDRTKVSPPAKGMLIFDTNQIYFHDGTTWNAVGGGSSGKTYTLSVNATNQLVLSDGTGSVATSVPIAGDVTGTTLGNTTVSRILGKQISIANFPSSGIQNLVYDGASGTWKLQAGSSVTVPTLSNGQILTGDGTTNSATTLSGDATLSVGALKVTGLQGSALPALSSTSTALNLLSYNATTSKWEFKDPIGANLMLKTVYDPTGKASDVFDLTSHSGVVAVANGGTGLSQTPASNQLLIGNASNGYSLSTLTAGTGISISNTSGTLTISSSGSGSLSLTTLGNSGASTLVGSVLNVPAYTLAGLGGISLSSLSATAPLAYNNLTGAFSITPATNLTDGYLSKTDWTIFNGKQGALTLTTTGTSGAATLVGNTLNIPNYASTTYSAGTGLTLTTNTFSVNASQNITTLSNLTTKGLVTTTAAGALGSTQGTGFLKDNGTGTISYDNSTYLTSFTESDPVVKAINGLVKSNGTTISAATAGTDYQVPLVSGTNIKTINGASVLGSGNITAVTTEADPVVKAISGIVKSNGTTISAAVAGTDYVATESDPTVRVINGIVKSNGTTLSAATAGTDYLPISGGSSVTTLGTIATGTWNGTKISETFGGTNQTTYATGDVLYASAANTLSKLGIGVNGQVLTVSGGVPSWQTVTGTGTVTNVTGNLPITVATGTTTPVINIAQANGTTNGYLLSTDWATFNSKQGAISLTTTGSSGAATFAGNTLNIPNYTLSGLGGISLTSLSASAPLTYNNGTGAFSIANAAADGTTKGAASFATNDFDATSGNISLDYTNGQAASATTKGFLTSADWTTFNNKQGTITLTTTGTSGAATLVGNTLNIPNYAGTTYTAGAGLTLAANTFSVNTSQNISTLTNLITKGLVTTTALGALGSTQGTGFLKDNGTGTISYDNSTYLTSFTESDPTVKAISGIVKSNGTTISAAVSGTDYAPATSGTSLLKGNGTGGFANAVAGTDYLTANQTITLSGDVTGSGTTAITTAIGASKVTNSMLAGSIAASKLIGTDITTVGTITAGVWNGTKISEAYGGTNQTTYAIGDILYASASNTLSKLSVGTAGQVLTVNSGVPSWQTAASGWALGGNSGTVDGVIGTGTNYIGTTDNVPLNFMVNNSKAGRIEQTISGSTFLGWSSGNSNTGGQNAAFGSQAMEKNVAGAANAGFGQLALNNNTTGNYNVAVGTLSMSNNTSGGNNIAIGVQANNNNTIGSGNTAIGYNANYSNVSSGFNTIVGIDAGFNNTGANNTAIGRKALFTTTTGSNNTALGFQADAGATITNATAIGANASVNTSNTIQLGDANVTTVNVGTGTTAKLVAGGLQVTGGTLAAGKVLTSDAVGNATWQAAASGWSLGGNTGTIDGVPGTGTNYVGTKDNVALNFLVNNTKAGRIDPSNTSTFFGYGSGLVNTGQGNTGFGAAGVLAANTTGNYNVAMGSGTLTVNTVGSQNAAFGHATLFTNTTGSNNTGAGFNALFFNTSGNFNTATGASSMLNNTTGSSNAAFGAVSMQFNTIGSFNSGIGDGALFNNTTGNNNTALGFNSSVTNTTGSNNTTLGYLADVSTAALTNATAVGANAKVTASNTIQLGDASVTTVNVGTSTTAKLVAGGLQVTGGTLAPGNVLTSDATGNATWQAAGAGSGWSLTGNGTTVAGTNFVGTTNDISLTFKVNNQVAGFIDNSTGSNNTLFGYQAGRSATLGISNSYFGFQAGARSTNTGSNNSGFGKFALTNNVGGADNTAIGYQTMLNNSDASSNTAIGRSAMYTMSFANAGTAYNTNNTGVGYQALYNTNPTSTLNGKFNTSLGYNSGQANTTGTSNTFVGSAADASSGTLTNATAIGANAYVGASNSLVLGSIATVNGASSNTNVGIGTTTPVTELQVTHGNGSPSAGNGLTIQNVGASNQNFAFFVSNSTGNLNLYDNNTFVGGFAQVSGTYTPVSDRRLKKNIQPLEEILPKLSAMQIRRYHFNKQSDMELTNIGVIAQELKEIFPELVKYSPENDRYTVDYLSMAPVAIKAIQEQQQLIKGLMEKIQSLETKLEKEQADKVQLQTQMDQLSSSIEQIKKSLGLDLKAKK